MPRSPCCAPPHGPRADSPWRLQPRVTRLIIRGKTNGVCNQQRDKFVPILLRKATRADIPQIEALIARSARGLSADEYRPSQIEGALRGAFGVDTQLLSDQTYVAAEEDGRLVGCGGWSFRSTLFGGDARTGRDSSLLDPRPQAGKIRA